MKPHFRKSFVYSAVFSVTVLIHAASETVGGPIQVVSPGMYADTEAPSSVGNLSTDIRLQQVYPASDFASLPAGYHTITEIAFRPNGSLNQPLTITFNSLLIRLSTTNASPLGLSTRFADNIGADETTVLNKTLMMSTANIGPLGGPKEFDYIISLETPFDYNPSDGNLLMDWTHFGVSESTRSDFVMDPGPEAHMISGAPGSTMAGSQFGGSVTQFTFIPEPSSLLLAATGAVAVLAAAGCRRRKRAA